MRVLVRDPSLKSGGGKSVELLFAMAVESHLRAPLHVSQYPRAACIKRINHSIRQSRSAGVLLWLMDPPTAPAP